MHLLHQILLSIDPGTYHSQPPPPAYRPRPDGTTLDKQLHQEIPPIRLVENKTPPCIHCINMMKKDNSEKSDKVSEETVTSEKVGVSAFKVTHNVYIDIIIIDCKLMIEQRVNLEFIFKIFGRLGPPPKQPRTHKFIPKCGKVGKGTRHMRRDGTQDEQVILLNEDLLKIYGADRWSRGTPTPVKAGSQFNRNFFDPSFSLKNHSSFGFRFPTLCSKADT